ncbi:MAG: hypothetical protein BWY75_02149 [bacterium ADurb.Bin425]|nr:MAG: hypothetical protein BWY75_02149 [bacterium ADurb.Bin425]
MSLEVERFTMKSGGARPGIKYLPLTMASYPAGSMKSHEIV